MVRTATGWRKCSNLNCGFEANTEDGWPTCCGRCKDGFHTSQCTERRRLKEEEARHLGILPPIDDEEPKPAWCCANRKCRYPKNARGGFETCCGKCYDGSHTRECRARRMHENLPPPPSVPPEEVSDSEPLYEKPPSGITSQRFHFVVTCENENCQKIANLTGGSYKCCEACAEGNHTVDCLTRQHEHQEWLLKTGNVMDEDEVAAAGNYRNEDEVASEWAMPYERREVNASTSEGVEGDAVWMLL